MTPLANIEAGIINGDWQLVCAGFNKLTGKKLTPVKTQNIKLEVVKPFDPDTASKRDLYKFMKSKFDIAPMKAYTIEELREMAMVHSLEETSVNDSYADELTVEADLKELKDGEAFLDGFRYHSGRSKLLPMDKLKVVAAFDPQLKGDDGPDREVIKRSPPKKITMKCLKCNKSFQNLASLGVDTGGEVKALCPICSESI